MNIIFKLILKDKRRISIERFPHEDEEGFISHLIKEYDPVEITRYGDGVIVYQEGDANAAKTSKSKRTGVKDL